MESDGDHKDCAEAKEDDGVDEDGETAGAHAVELRYAAIVAGDLAQQPRCHRNEEDHREHHRAPVARHG